jgi:hypothetical protein
MIALGPGMAAEVPYSDVSSSIAFLAAPSGSPSGKEDRLVGGDEAAS